MTLETLRAVLGWCTILNAAFLSVWILMILVGRKPIYRLHSRLFPMSEERFTAIHYAGMAAYKIFIIAANLVPYLALRIVG